MTKLDGLTFVSNACLSHSYAIPPSVGMTKQGRNDKLVGLTFVSNARVSHSYAIPPSVGMTKQGRNDKLDGMTNWMGCSSVILTTNYAVLFTSTKSKTLQRGLQIRASGFFTIL
jgi:hypothetical protein